MDLPIRQTRVTKRRDIGLAHVRGRPCELLGVGLEGSNPLFVTRRRVTERLTVLAQSVVRAVDAADRDGDRLAFHARE